MHSNLRWTNRKERRKGSNFWYLICTGNNSKPHKTSTIFPPLYLALTSKRAHLSITKDKDPEVFNKAISIRQGRAASITPENGTKRVIARTLKRLTKDAGFFTQRTQSDHRWTNSPLHTHQGRTSLHYPLFTVPLYVFAAERSLRILGLVWRDWNLPYFTSLSWRTYCVQYPRHSTCTHIVFRE
jgi:hypothetical protein